MKHGLIVFLFCGGSLIATPKHGNNCRVVSVNDSKNPWEEGLGVFGDPDADSDSQNVGFWWKGKKLESVSVGQMSWTPNTQVVTITDDGKSTQYQIDYSKSASVLLKVYRSEMGVILHRPHFKNKWTMVGTFDCSSVKEVEAASKADKNVRALKSSEVKKLPKTTRDNLNRVDLPFELGDGYYDLKFSRYYVVNSKDGQDILGYLLWARLHYTEDNEDIEVLVRFDRNGLRLGKIEQ